MFLGLMPLRGERLNVLLARSLREETSLAMRLTILSPIMERSIQVKALARSVFDMHDDPLAKMGAFRLTNNMNNARHLYSGQATSSPYEQLLCS